MSCVTGYLVSIWTRDDYGETEPSHMFAVQTHSILEQMLEKYIRKHREVEDYLEDEEFEEKLQNIKTLKDVGPELNCAYEIKVSKIDFYLDV